jgi:hypothetical protein
LHDKKVWLMQDPKVKCIVDLSRYVEEFVVSARSRFRCGWIYLVILERIFSYGKGVLKLLPRSVMPI